MENTKISRPDGLVVLSLFDGMSCGRLALERAGIKIAKYLASEIKPFAVAHTQAKYPDTIMLGDVTRLHYDKKTKTLYSMCERETIDRIGPKEDLDPKDFPTKESLDEKGLAIMNGQVCKVKFTKDELDEYDKNGYEIEDASGEVIKWTLGEPKYTGEIDILIGGSPCQDFSSANSFALSSGKGYGLQGPKSRLFYEYTRLKKEATPKYFLLENVKMRKDSEETLTNFLGVPGTHINSSLVAIANRPRVYWTNIYDGKDIPQPKDLGLNYQDYKLMTLPHIEKMLYMERFPMCYELFDSTIQKDLDKYVEKDETGKVIKGIVTITDDDIEKICAIPSNKWAREELDKAFGRKLTDREFVDELHKLLQEAFVKKSPSRDKMWKGDTQGRFKCKDITNEKKTSTLTRKVDRFPNSGMVTIGDNMYCRFLTKIEQCKCQSVPYHFLNDLPYNSCCDCLGDGWQVDTIKHILEPLNDKYDFS